MCEKPKVLKCRYCGAPGFEKWEDFVICEECDKRIFAQIGKK